jgi:hypothetical protein
VRRFLHALWIGGVETLLGVALVAVLSAVFLGALLLMFPKGSGLVDLYGDYLGAARGAKPSRPGFSEALDGPLTAHLSRVERQVKDRPPDAVVWNASQRGMAVQHQHAIQTLDRSGATISIAGRDAIHLGPNSLIVFHQPQRGEAGEKRRASIALLGGELRGEVPAGAGPAPDLDIVTANASTRFQGDGQEPASYSVRVDADNASTIQLFSGSAEITVGDERATLGPNEAVRIFPDQTIGEPVKLPPAPQALEPHAEQPLVFGAVAPRVTFRWTPVPGAEGYRLVIARDAALGEPLHDAVCDGNVFEHGALEHGTYYWQVRAIRGGIEGLPSPVGTVDLVQDTEAPSLRVELEPAAGGLLIVRGTTEPGAVVHVNDATLTASANGVFEHRIQLSPGVNMIVVETVDAVGNSAYFSEYVDASGRPRRSP